MSKRCFRQFAILFCFVSLVFIPSSLYAKAAGHAVETGVSSSSSFSDDLSKKAVRNRMRMMRQQRIEQMPYLDRALIRSEINKRSVVDKHHFVHSGAKTLDDIIRRAIEVHLPARVARERISLAKRRILVSLRNFLPEVSVVLEHQQGRLSDDFKSRSARVNTRIPIFRGGVLWNSLQQERANLKTEQIEYDHVVADLIGDVAEAFYEYNRALEVLGERKSMMDSAARYKDISRKKYEGEIISEIEHLNVESIFSEMDYDFESAIQELELAKLELKKFLGVGLNDEVKIRPHYDIDGFLASNKGLAGADVGQDALYAGPVNINKETYSIEEVQVPNIDLLVDLAYKHRPELQVEAARLKAARYEEKVQFGELMPQADLILETERRGEAFANTGAQTRDPSLRTGYRVGIEMTWNAAGNEIQVDFDNEKTAPNVSQFLQQQGTQRSTVRATFGLFDGLDVFANTKQAEIDKLDQLVALDEAEKEVIREVKEAFFDFQKASLQVRSSMQKLYYRERLLKLSKHRLDKNEIEVSEYINTASDLLNERIELHRTLADYYIARSKLNHAVGKKVFE